MARCLPILPFEIIDIILIYIKSLPLALSLNRFSIIKHITTENIDYLWAIRNGHRNLLNHFVLNDKIIVNREFQASIVNAVLSNHIQVLVYINNYVKPLSFHRHLLACAAGRGLLGVVKYLHSVGCRTGKEALTLACSNGHLQVVKWLHYNRTEGTSHKALQLASQNGFLDVVQFLVQVRGEKIRFESVR